MKKIIFNEIIINKKNIIFFNNFVFTKKPTFKNKIIKNKFINNILIFFSYIKNKN